MTPYEQIVIHDPKNNQFGDCFRACIACLLDEEPADIPHVFVDGCDTHVGLKCMREYLRSRGLGYVEIPLLLNNSPTELGIEGHYIMTGRSPRVFDSGRVVDHCVIAHGAFNVVWDPHPTRQGLAGPIPYGSTQVYLVGFLARL